jgi:predicted DsbA family dithiol-disulfide isomerase
LNLRLLEHCLPGERTNLPRKGAIQQHTLEDADLNRFAEAVGLQMQQFTRDLEEHLYLARIEEDMESGERSGVQGTPTFFINGVLYLGSWEQDVLLPALEAASQVE